MSFKSALTLAEARENHTKAQRPPIDRWAFPNLTAIAMSLYFITSI